ncbi:DUF3110 domain-containing protein [Cyanobium sp. NIES-981]|uniref:DUF3110 domain-containing protein n=1 Tax=Cyanobium sp. NIES-981 TaxID=1851505 RepID=UPI0007DD44C0|nr:DUF3110 domain-containing protein [Cyanobium sp. NIES-981]SBO42201.1 conserved protein of unknown function [Cyanobium sp. NIES-981]
MPVHVLLFDPGTDQEGIHSLEINGRTVVLLFEARDDAERYAGLLEAQDFPVPSVEALDRSEMEQFCRDSGYEARFVPVGFLPQTAEERLLIAPPERNMDVHNWQEQAATAGTVGGTEAARPAASERGAAEPISSGDPELEAFRRQLEGLL